jgi:hypothetical protein
MNAVILTTPQRYAPLLFLVSDIATLLELHILPPHQLLKSLYPPFLAGHSRILDQLFLQVRRQLLCARLSTMVIHYSNVWLPW